MRALWIAVTMALATGQAAASGGLSCESGDGPAKIEIEAGITRGLGSPVFSLTGSVEVKDNDVAADLRKMQFDKAHLAQYWLDGEDLRLLLYRERDAEGVFGSVELTVRAQPTDEEGTFAGTYELTISDMTGQASEAKTKAFKGELSCFVE